ncbi:MAG: prepilin-type N-terminal cleavage/methylation domain-containing protein [Candidatus Bathyarchaeia archaeon]
MRDYTDLNRRGFTLPELMIVIIIIGILAVIAIPIYNKMVEESRVSEARAMISAIVSAEKAYMQRNGDFLQIITPNGDDFKDKLKVDLGESAYFNYTVTSTNTKRNFTVTAVVNSIGVSNGGLPAGGIVTYNYNMDNDPNPRGTWGGTWD